MEIRPRRNRQSEAWRDLIQENHLSLKNLMYPVFVMEGKNQKVAIASMPGIYRFTLDLLLEEIEECLSLGIKSFALFAQIPEEKKILLPLKVIGREIYFARLFRKFMLNFQKSLS